MAAPFNFSSGEWIKDIKLFYACLEAGFVDKHSLNTFIHPDCVDKVYKGLCQFFYWARKLQVSENEAVLTFALMGKDGLIRPNIQALQGQIVDILGPGTIKGINYTENANFVSLIMVNSGAALTVRQEVSSLDGALLCYVNTRSPNTYGVRILWSPVGYPLEGIIQSLKPWCDNTSLQFEKEAFPNGEAIVTNKAFGQLTLKEGVFLPQLPHIVKLSNTINKHALVIIRERSPLCLKCRIEGHVRRFCPSSKCIKCGVLHERNGACLMKTFASVVGSGSSSEGGLDKMGLYSSGKLGPIDVFNDNVSTQCEGGGSSGEVQVVVESEDFSLVTRRVTRSKNLRKNVSFSEKSLNSSSVGLSHNGYKVLHDEMDFIVTNEDCKEVVGKDEASGTSVGLGAPDFPHNLVCTVDSRIKYFRDDNSLSDEMDSKRGKLEDQVADTAAIISGKCDIVVQPEGISPQDRSNQVYDSLEDDDISLLNDVSLRGFKEGTSCSEVYDFLGSPRPLEVWHNVDENGAYHGAFGATYSTPEEAQSVHDRKKAKYHGTTIHFSRFSLPE